MKNLLCISLLLCALGTASGQQTATEPVPVKKFTTGVDVFTDIWQGSYTNMTPSNFNRGMEAYVMYNVPMEKTPLVFSLGLGVGTHNLYTNAALVLDANNVYSFQPISSKLGTGTAVQYKKYKINVTYMDIPFEFRYKSKSNFKLALGMKFGFVLSSHIKYKGEDFMNASTQTIKVKYTDIKNLERWRYGFTGKIGFGSVEFFGYYSLTNLFRKDEGPEMYPISLGLTLRPF